VFGSWIHLFRFALLLVILAFPGVRAQDVEDENDEETALERARETVEVSCRDEQGRPESWLDRTHSYLSEQLCEPAAWFDGFFGDPRADEETPVGTFIRMRNQLSWDQNKDFGYDLRVSANISLPRISDRVRLLVTRDDALEGELDDSRGGEGEEQTRLGLRFLLSDDPRNSFDLDGTVKVSGGGLNPRGGLRYRHTSPITDTSLVRLTQTTFWERDDGFGTSLRADLDWLPNNLTLGRLTGRGLIAENSDDLEWRTGLVGFRQLGQKTAIRSEIGMFGDTKARRNIEEYFVNFRFRRAFLRDWLFYELQPEHAWPVDEETGKRRADWRFIFTLEIQFENRAADDGQIDHYRGR